MLYCTYDEIHYQERERIIKARTEELHRLLNNLLKWSVHVKKYLYWSSMPMWRIILYENDEMIGSLSIVRRNIVRNDKRLLTAGSGNVCIKKEFQGKGLAQQMLNFTKEKLVKENFNIALLFCDEKRTKLMKKWDRCEYINR